MNDNNKSNNPYGKKDYFGFDDIPEVDFTPQEVSFEPQIPPRKPSESSARSVDIGSINSDPAAPVQAPTEPVRPQKFVVTIQESDLTSPEPDEVYTDPLSDGGVFFNAPRRTTRQVHQPEKPAGTPKKKKKRKKSDRSFTASFLSVVLVFSLALSCLGISCINDVLAINRSDDKVSVTIPKDATFNEVCDILSDNGLVHQKLFCKIFHGIKKSFLHTKETEFLSGVYTVSKNLGFEGYLSEFMEEQVAANTINVFFQEGWSAYQMFDKLESFGVCKKSELIAALEGSDYDYAFISNIPDDANRVFKLEGYLFPDTYEMYETCDANTIIRKMLANFESKWNEDYQKRADELGMTMDEVITLASIIQREAADADQMPIVSSVLHNRLNHSVSYPTLGCDSTLNYINKYVEPNVSNIEAQAYAVYYDTSSIRGLPVGPVCNPGIDAIEAALYPEETDYYYFCHDKSGEIYLARSNAEHDRNLLEVLRKNNG